MDSIQGCPEVQVPAGHLARAVRRIVESFDTSLLEENYSSLGRHGFHPRQVLAVWLYGSMIGVHESTKLGAAMETDAALRLLSGCSSQVDAHARRLLLAGFGDLGVMSTTLAST
jgi:transposase